MWVQDESLYWDCYAHLSQAAQPARDVPQAWAVSASLLALASLGLNAQQVLLFSLLAQTGQQSQEQLVLLTALSAR